MAATKYPIVSPLGRIVEGDPWTPQEKDNDGNLRVFKHGANAGKPNPQYYVGLAVPKQVPHPQNPQQLIDNPDFANFYAFVDQVARAAWPNLFPNGGPCVNSDFAWKIRDGDGMVRKGKNAGKSLAERPGFKGCWIISFASSFAPQIVVETSPGVYAEITDKSFVQRGYYVRVGASVSSNESMQTPGLYINLEKVELKGRGEVIQSGASAAETFGGQQSAVTVIPGMQALTAADLAGAPAGFGGAPAGFPSTPAAPGLPVGGAPAPTAGAPAPSFSAPAATAFPGSPAPLGQPSPAASFPNPAAPAAASFPNPAAGLPVGAAPSPQIGAGALPAAATAPLPGAQTMTPAPTAAPAAAPAYSGFMGQRVMLPAANGAPYEAFIAQGWTDETLIASGYMAMQ